MHECTLFCREIKNYKGRPVIYGEWNSRALLFIFYSIFIFYKFWTVNLYYIWQMLELISWPYFKEKLKARGWFRECLKTVVIRSQRYNLINWKINSLPDIVVEGRKNQRWFYLGGLCCGCVLKKKAYNRAQESPVKRLVKHSAVIKAWVCVSWQSHWENRQGHGPEGRCSVCILVFMVCCYFSFSFTICFLLFFPSPFSDFEIYTLAMWAVQRTGFWDHF